MKRRKKKNVIISVRLKLRQKLLAVLFFIAAFSATIILLMFILVNPIIKKAGKSSISEIASKELSLGIFDAMKGTITYDDLVHIVTDSSGKIAMLQANSIQINSLSRKVIDTIYTSLEPRLLRPLEIPLGTFFGLPILSGLGPKVEINAKPYLSIKCNFLSKFTQAGINQTVHQIYIKVVADITMVVPFCEINKIEETEVLIAESLIIGEIPSTYLMAEEKSDLLNMVG